MISYRFLTVSLLSASTFSPLAFAQSAPAAATTTPVEAAPAPAVPTVAAAPSPARRSEDEYRPEYIADEGQPMPSGYHRTTRSRRGLVIAGSIVFGISYGVSTLIATASDDSRERWLFVPVFGPLADLASRSCTSSSYDADCRSGQRAFAFDAVVQGAGAAMLITGLVLRRNLFARDNVEAKATNPSWAVAPMRLGQAAWGVGAAGNF